MRKFLLIVFLPILFPCSSKKKSNVYFHDGLPRTCSHYKHKKVFDRIVDDKFLSIVESDTIFINEIRYECTSTALKLSEAMFNTHGKWDDFIYPSNQSSPLLVWNHLNLLDGDTIQYTVITSGEEDWNLTYSSVMVFEKGKDILDEDIKKQELKEHFASLVEYSEANKNEEFYQKYWETRNPNLKFSKNPFKIIKSKSDFIEAYE